MWHGAAMPDTPPARPVAPRPVAVVILAAGMGTRMKSDLHKVLHPVAGRPMLLHLLASVEALAPERIVVVAGARREQVAAAVGSRATIAVQAEQHGTAHAVRAAQEALAGFDGDVLVLFGDAPLIETATMRRLLAALTPDTGVAVLGFRPADAGAYGRIVADADGRIARMVEFKDASPAERAVDLCNSGVLAVRSAELWPLLARVGNANAAGEYYLPDIVALADRPGRVIETDAAEVAGVNSRAELAAVEAGWQARRRAAMMAAGVTLVAPDTVWFAHDTVVGRDVTIEPNVVFGPGVTVADGATIHAFCHIAGASDRRACRGRPLRPPPPRRRPRGEGQGRQLRRGQGSNDRRGRQGQPPELHRRRQRRRRRQHRRRHDHLQLRRLLQVPHDHRRGRVHRLEQRARRPGEHRRQCHRRRGQCRDGRCRGGRARLGARRADGETRLGNAVPGGDAGAQGEGLTPQKITPRR